MILGISTVWQSSRIRDGCELLACVQDLDHICGVELEYRIQEDATERIAQVVRSGAARVMSVHNFFPHPSVLPIDKASGDAFLLSSRDPEQQRLSIAYTRRTIEHAAELGAKAVVLHLGRVEIDDPMEQITALYDKGQVRSRECKTLIRKCLKERAAKREPFLETVIRSLSLLMPVADRLGIQLGLENRYYLREIPDIDELGILLDEFKGGPVGHWHDMGHSAVHGNLGAQAPREWMERYADRLVGVHIHDTKGYEDHLAPGEGETNFHDMAPCFHPEILKILEIKPSVSPEAVRRGISIVKGICDAMESHP